MKVVLDTHILVHAANDSLTANRKQLLLNPDTQILFSSISLWELAKLIEFGKLQPTESLENYLLRFSQHPRYTEIPFSPKVLALMVEIAPKMHKDPADQLIVATALAEEAALMTNDKPIKTSKLVKVV